MPRIEENAGSSVYMVDYDEDQWNAYDAESQADTIKRWIDKARPMKCTHFALRLHPDTMFPSGDKEMPYIAKSLPIASDRDKPFTVMVQATVQVDEMVYGEASELERLKLIDRARVAASANLPPKGRYVVKCGDKMLATGAR